MSRVELYILGGQSCIYLEAGVVYIGRPELHIFEGQSCIYWEATKSWEAVLLRPTNGSPLSHLFTSSLLLVYCFQFPNTCTSCLFQPAQAIMILWPFIWCVPVQALTPHPSQQKYDFHCFEPFLVQYALLCHNILIYYSNCNNFFIRAS